MGKRLRNPSVKESVKSALKILISTREGFQFEMLEKTRGKEKGSPYEKKREIVRGSERGNQEYNRVKSVTCTVAIVNYLCISLY